jgi:hypothetical protein
MYIISIIAGTFNRNTKLSVAGIEELMNLLESSEYTKKIQSNGFSESSNFVLVVNLL